ncbi:MAG: lipid A export ATP-binding/permease protein MsbA [Caldimonas sp.]|nr:MAG: lipid A export ATP-binding/permease protein MsbA [Caldimonas sp.]
MSLKVTARRLLEYIRPHKAGVILGIICFFSSAAIEPLVPALLKVLLDSGFKADIGFPLWMVPLVVIGLFAVRGGLAFCGTYLFNWSTSQAVLKLRTDLLAAVMRADASLYSQMSPGVMATRVINDPQSATQSLAGALTTLLRDGTTLVALLGYLFYLNWQLTLVSLLTMPVLAYVVKTVQRRVLQVGGRAYDTQLKLVGIVDDISRAWRVVRTFDAEEFERRRFSEEATRLRRLVLKNVAAASSMTPLTQVVASTGVALILTLALIQANRGEASVGEFVAFITALLMTISPMRHLTDVTQPIIGGLIGARACFGLMDTPPEPDPGTKLIDTNTCKGHIEFRDVSVRYPGSEQLALNRLSLEVPSGENRGLGGPFRIGQVHRDQCDAGLRGACRRGGSPWTASMCKTSAKCPCAASLPWFRKTSCSSTARSPTTWPTPSRRIPHASKPLCGLPISGTSFQAQPEGLQATIGTNGSKLSGGQRQRLAIARALYKNARIWVFDEATSALDTESERIVQQSIEQWHGEKTLILIAHRLSTVRNADIIYVLAEGRVLESGRHDDLMQRNGLYASMVRAQALGVSGVMVPADGSHPYVVRRPSESTFLTIRGLRYHVRRWGSPEWVRPESPALVMLHGWMDVGASFQFVVDAMVSPRYVLAPRLAWLRAQSGRFVRQLLVCRLPGRSGRPARRAVARTAGGPAGPQHGGQCGPCSMRGFARNASAGSSTSKASACPPASPTTRPSTMPPGWMS